MAKIEARGLEELTADASDFNGGSEPANGVYVLSESRWGEGESVAVAILTSGAVDTTLVSYDIKWYGQL